MKIIHLEDSVSKYMEIFRVLRGIGEMDITWVTNMTEGIEKIKEAQMMGTPFDLAISDMHYPLRPGIEADWSAGERFIEILQEEHIELPVVICSSIRYSIPEAYGCLWYSNLSDWEWELRDFVAGIKK